MSYRLPPPPAAVASRPVYTPSPEPAPAPSLAMTPMLPPMAFPALASCPTPETSQPVAPAWQIASGKTVILDPGHGGDDSGASHHGLREKDINLDLALRTAALLRSRGVTVHLTRQSDVFIPLQERSAYANTIPGATFVSIHTNAAAAAPEAFGVESFVLSQEFGDYERGIAAARTLSAAGLGAGTNRQALANLTTTCRAKGPALAASLQRSLTARVGEPDRGVKTANLAVLRETYFCPAVLVEVGFLTNARTANRMRTDDWRRRTAEGLADGICTFLRQPD